MPNLRSIAILWALLFLAGCANIRVSQDYPDQADFAALKTYAWMSESQEKTGDLRLDSALRDQRIRKAIDRYLQDKGYRRKSDPLPDFYVAYRQKIYSRITAENGSGFVFGMGSVGSRGGVGFSTGSYVSDYDELMLVIDILDADNGDLLWRGTGTRSFVPHTTPEKTTQRIDATVEKILAQFPPQ